MTARERWEAVLTGKTPDRVPMDIWITPEAWASLEKHLGCEGDAVLARLHIDRPIRLEPAYAGPPLDEGSDIWGLAYREVAYGTGTYEECISHPLAGFTAVDEIEANYTWPSADAFDFSVLPEQMKGNEDRPVIGGGSEPFLVYKNLRGDEQAFLDLVMYPEIVAHCLDRMFGFCHEFTRRVYEAVPGAVTITYVAEDLAGQENLMYAPEHIRSFLLPHMRRMNELAKEHGAHPFFHSDGAVRDIVPDMIDIGSEVLNPIQWRCPGMDREGLKRDFGDRLLFHGGVDNQQTLPFGSVKDVEEEVRDNLRILGEGGGYILAPCHNIQAVSPPENIVALYEAGYENGWC